MVDLTDLIMYAKLNDCFKGDVFLVPLNWLHIIFWVCVSRVCS